MVRTVAVHASHVITCVRRNGVMPLVLRFAMAFQASFVRFRFRELGKADDLRCVPSAGHVLGARPVTGLAAVTIFFRGLKMRRALKLFLVDIFMAPLARLGSGISG